MAGEGLPREMVKAQETRRLLANTASEPQEPLSPSQSHGSLEEDCPHPLSVNSPGRGTQAPGRHGLFSHPWRGPGCWSHLGPGGEGCCLPHIKQAPRLHKMGVGGVCSPKGLPSQESRCLFRSGWRHRGFLEPEQPSFHAQLYSLVIV